MTTQRFYMGVPENLMPEGMIDKLVAGDTTATLWFSKNLPSMLREHTKETKPLSWREAKTTKNNDGSVTLTIKTVHT